MERALLQGLREAVSRGFQSDGGFKQAGWDLVIKAVGETTTQMVTKKICNTKLEQSKKIWRSWKAHIADCCSGWGWDDARGVPVSEKAVMDSYFDTHRDRESFRRQPPAFQEDLEFIFGNRLATGAAAVSIDEVLQAREASVVPSVENNQSGQKRAASDQPPTVPKRRNMVYHQLGEIIQNTNKQLATTMDTISAIAKAHPVGSAVEELFRGKDPFLQSLPVQLKRKLLSLFEESECKAVIFNSLPPDERMEWVRGHLKDDFPQVPPQDTQGDDDMCSSGWEPTPEPNQQLQPTRDGREEEGSVSIPNAEEILMGIEGKNNEKDVAEDPGVRVHEAHGAIETHGTISEEGVVNVCEGSGTVETQGAQETRKGRSRSQPLRRSERRKI